MQETKEIKKDNAGVTLVSLVITIIVLLILAGVGLSVLTGENGLIAKAKYAAEQYNQSAGNEAETVNEILNMINENKEENEEIEQPVIQPITAADINGNPSKYYGKEVLYTPQNGVPVAWKIFYADDENIYLIASEYVENSYAPNVSNEIEINREGTHAIYFETIIKSDTYKGTEDVLKEDEDVKKWINHINEFTSENNNMKATAYLLDTNIWSSFKDLDNKAQYAVGGLTLELFIASYNDTHSQNKIQYEVTDENGYKIKWYTDEDYDFTMQGLSDEDNLYIVSNNTNVNDYLLAAPSAQNESYLIGINYKGNIVLNDSYGNLDNGFRPIICLNPEVQLIEQDGKYVIQ